MNGTAFRQALQELKFTQTDAARLLSTNGRTVRRWVEDDAVIPGPAERAISAWIRLRRYGLPWRPDEILLSELTDEKIAEQIKLHRQYVIGLDEVLERVKSRGGPAAPWKVDLKECRATLGEALEINFYLADEGLFSTATYRRMDGPLDLERDRHLIDDAHACIAAAIAQARLRGPIVRWFTLYADDGSSKIDDTDQRSLDDALFVFGNRLSMDLSATDDSGVFKLFLLDEHRDQWSRPNIKVCARPRS